MTKTKNTKHALLTSGLALVMCVSMLIGSTFAWFTDSVTSKGNIIKSGTLDVEMYWAKGNEDPDEDATVWTDASKGAIFNNDKWEPGYVDAKHIKVANVGSLALSYQLRVVANGIVSKLGDVIDVYCFDSATQLTRDNVTQGRKLGTLTEIFGTEKNISNAVYGDLLANEEKTVTIAFKMQESAGNEYQNLSVGTDFSVELIAIQHTYEKDSFDENYDKNALSAAVPAALVRELENKDISATLGIGGTAYAYTLDAAYQFEPTQSYEELLKSEYKYYLADFIVSADKNVPADSIALAGYYDAWCKLNNDNWVAMVNIGTDITAGTEIALVETLGYGVHYKDICQYGNDGIGFRCGVADLTGANAGTTITVKLCLFETTADPNGSSASYDKVQGAEPIVIGEFKYTFPEEVSTGAELTAALENGKSVTLLNNMDVDTIEIPAGADVDIDLNGNQLSVVGLEATANVEISGGTLVHKDATYPAVSVKDGGNLVMNDVYIVCNKYCNLITSGSFEAAEYVGLQVFGGTCKLNNCNIEVNVDKVRYANSAYGISIHGGNLIMNGGSIKVTSPGSTKPDFQAAFAAWQEGEKTLTLNNVTIDAKNYFEAGKGNTTIITTDTNGSWDGKCVTGKGTYTIQYN